MSDELNPVAARILIAEDEAIVAEDLAMTLQDLGYQVVGTASTGLLAIQLAEELKPDLVLTDISLRGEINGIQASEQIRARFDIPVIFLTAYAETDVLSRAKVTEPYGFLAKPFSYHILKITIDAALYKHAADKRIRESEERYRMLVEQSLDGIVLVQGTTVRFVNSALAKMFGFQNKEEAVGQSVRPFEAPEYRDVMAKMGVEREESKSVPDCYEFKALRRDGTSFAAEVKVNVTTYHGERARQGIIRDISERKKLEESLRRSQEMLSLALEGANLGIWDWDLTTGKATWSERINRMLGYEPNEVEPDLKNWKKLVHPDDWSGVSETLNLHLEGKIPKFEIQYRSRNKSGAWQWLHAQGTVSEFDSDGKPIRITGVVSDITERRKADEELQKLASVVRYTDDLINLATFDGKMIFLNEAGCRMLGIDSTDVGQHKILEVIPEHLLQTAQREVLPLLMTGGAWEGELQYRNIKTGEIIDVHAKCFAIRDSNTGSPICFANVSRDISERKKAEEALRKNEELLTNSQALAHLGSWEIDLIQNHLVWSPEVYRIFGLQPMEFEATYEAFLDAVHPDDRIKVDNAYTGSIREGKDTYEVEHRVVRKGSREIRIVHEKCEHFRDSSGKIVRSVGMVQDITERRKAEAALKESEEFNRRIVHHAPFGIIYLAMEGAISFTNPASNRIFEVPEDKPSPLIGLNIFQLPLIAEQPHVRARFEELVGEGRPQSDIELAYRSPLTGKDYVLLASATPRISVDGSIVGSVVMLADITDRKKTEEALRESEERYRILAENSLTGIFVHQDGQLVYINRRAAEGLGYSEDELIGKSVWEIVAPEDREMAKGREAARLQGNQTPVQYQCRVLTRNGEIRCLEARATVIEHNGRPATLANVVDITDRKRAEEALRQSENRYRELVETASDLIYQCDSRGSVTFANSVALKKLGYQKEEFMGRHYLEFIQPDYKN